MSIYSGIAPYYDGIFPLREERLRYARSLCDTPGTRILDIGCATGSLALELAKSGHRLTGIDLDSEMVRIAVQRARAQGLALEFEILDMRTVGRLFSPGTFDVVLCLGNTIVHLPDAGAVRAFLGAVAGLLAEGGRLAVALLNYDRLVSGGGKPLPVIETETARFVRSSRYDAGRHRVTFSTELTVKATGLTHREEATLYPLGQRELRDMLPAAGLASLAWHADFSGRPFDPADDSYIALLRRL